MAAVAAGIAIAALLVLVFPERLLWDLGQEFVDSEPPRHADVIVVLGGDYRGNRVLKGVELLRAGYAPGMIVSGPFPMFGEFEAQRAVQFAISHGAPADRVSAFIRNDASTVEEARDLVPEMRRRGVHTVLLVTSAFHTARAARIFRRTAPDLKIIPVGAFDPNWCEGYWWKNRECRKTWLVEEAKTFADLLGI
jgi:uncharacterized SAM-binding protein YcdF (DUF218 family)